MRIANADVYKSDGQFHREDVFISDGCFSQAQAQDEDILDASGCYAIPGLIDIHFHGALGADVCDMSIEAFEKIAEYELQNGITAICPATLTLPVEDLLKVLSIGAQFASKGSKNCSDLVGFNMEGPFISKAKKGSQNEKYILKCDSTIVDRFVESSRGLCRIVGLAPETNPGFEQYISEVKDRVKVSLAHTDTDYDTAMRAFNAGADHVVHLYNAMRGLHHREPGLVGAAADSSATCEIICDGVHVSASAVRAAYKLMGPERMILISDSLRATGMEDGLYDLGGQQVRKQGNLCTLVDEGNIAGSVSNLFDCLKTAVTKMGIPLKDAVASATIIPAKCIGIDAEHGSIEPGKKGNMVLVEKSSFTIKRVIKDGKFI